MAGRKVAKGCLEKMGVRSFGGSVERPHERAYEQDGSSGFLDELDHVQEVEFPPGLDILLDNLHRDKKKFNFISLGLVDEEYVERKYKDMKSKVCNKFLTMLKVNQNCDILEKIKVPAQSRYNPEYKYSSKVIRQLSLEMNDLRKATHIVLTFSPERVEMLMPDCGVSIIRFF